MLRAVTFLLLAVAAVSARQPDAAPTKAPVAMPGGDVPTAFRAFIVWDKRYPVPAELLDPDEGKREEVRKQKPNLPKVVVDPADPTTKTLRDVRDRTNRSHCLVCANGLNPVAVVFAPRIPTDPADPLAALLKDLDQATLDRKEASFATTVAFLVLPDELQFDAQRDKFVGEAKAMAEQAKLRAIPVGLAEKKSAATAAWKLDGNNAEAVTVVFYNKLRVVGRWTFEDGKPTDANRKAILDAIEKEVPAPKQ